MPLSKHLAISLLALCWCLVASWPAPARAVPLTVLVTEISPPSSYLRNGQLTGYSVQVVREIQRRLMDHTPILIRPWARAYKMALTGPGVGLFATTRTPAREDAFRWVGPLMRVKWAFYGRRGDSPRLADLEDARRVPAIGTYHQDAREQHLRSLGFTNLESVSDNFANLRKLMAGRIDLLASSNLAIGQVLDQVGMDRNSLEEALVFQQVELYIAFSPDTDPETLTAWDAALASMHADGSLAAIHARWFPGVALPSQVRLAP